MGTPPRKITMAWKYLPPFSDWACLVRTPFTATYLGGEEIHAHEILLFTFVKYIYHTIFLTLNDDSSARCPAKQFSFLVVLYIVYTI